MKRLFLAVFILITCNSLIAQFAVDSTKTMNSTKFLALRNATEPTVFTDEIMRFYWCKAVGIDPPIRDGDLMRDVDYVPIDKSSKYARESFWGAIGHDMPITYPPTADTTKLNLAKEYLLNPDFPITNPGEFYLDRDSLWTNVQQGDVDCIPMGQLLMNVSFIVDNLWHYVSPAEQDSLYNRLDNIAYFVNLILNDPNYGTPIGGYSAGWSRAYIPDSLQTEYGGYSTLKLWTNYQNMRIVLDAALGFAGCVLNNAEYIQTAEDDLFDAIVLSDGGFLDLNLSESGIYNEGMDYTNFAFGHLSVFFSARKRITIAGLPYKDWFAEQKIEDVFRKSLHLITPDYSSMAFDDVYTRNFDLDGELQPPISSPSIIGYYYQGSDSAARNHIKWLLDGYNNKYTDGVSNIFPMHWMSLQKLYTYENRTAPTGTTPSYLSDGIYNEEDSEFTIIRGELDGGSTSLDREIFQNTPTLIVNHERSAAVNHEDSDQGSFSLWHKGRQLLIDPGYMPNRNAYYLAKEWLASPFAHNLIMINPYDAGYPYNYNEADELAEYLNATPAQWNNADPDTLFNNTFEFAYNEFEPAGIAWIEDDINYLPPTDLAPANPAYKKYLIDNEDILHLKVTTDYDDNEVLVSRNFYSFDISSSSPYFVIYDDLDNYGANENEYMNQLHFAVHPGPGNAEYLWGNPLDTLSTGVFEFETSKSVEEESATGDKLYLSGAMGSLHTASKTLLPELPQGLINNQYILDNLWTTYLTKRQWEHKALRINTTTSEDEKFLTLLFPSEVDTNRIEDINSSGSKYAVKVDHDTETGYYVIGDSSFTFSFDANNFDVNGSFLAIKGETISYDTADTIQVSNIILNSGDYIECHDLTRTHSFVYYQSEEVYEELLASYTDNDELHITIKKDNDEDVKYKILRGDVEPEDLTSVTVYGYQIDPVRTTTIENINNLAFDDEYFYVNYSYDELIAENLFGELMIYHGAYYISEIDQNITFSTGDISLSGNISILRGNTVTFLPGAQIQMAEGSSISTDGVLYAVGTEQQGISFEGSGSGWTGIFVDNQYRDSRVEFTHCAIQDAVIGVKVKGTLRMNYSLVHDNLGGILLQKPESFTIENSEIYENANYGILVMDSYTLQSNSHLSHNHIHNNNFGMWFYNSSAYAYRDSIYTNNLSGILASNLSDPVFEACYIGNTLNGNPEIQISAKSYPVVDYYHNDIEFTGTSIKNMDSQPSEYFARGVWWGTTDVPLIMDSFDPSAIPGSNPYWDVIVDPIATAPHTYELPLAGGGRFHEGFQAEKDGDLTTAKTKYELAISEDENSIEALWSASRMLNCVSDSLEYVALKDFYDALAESSVNEDIANIANELSAYCDRQLEDYQHAIDKYEELLDGDQSYLDSLYTVLDIIHTYLEASGEDRAAGVTLSNDKVRIRNQVQAKEMEDNLMDLILERSTEGLETEMVPETIIMHNNYPNPFNPSTTINFSVPTESKVNITVYNIKGQTVKTLTNEKYDRGNHQVVWSGKDSSNNSVASGVYFYKLNVGGKEKGIKKMLLLK